jgi:hypothetical protein
MKINDDISENSQLCVGFGGEDFDPEKCRIPILINK